MERQTFPHIQWKSWLEDFDCGDTDNHNAIFKLNQNITTQGQSEEPGLPGSVAPPRILVRNSMKGHTMNSAVLEPETTAALPTQAHWVPSDSWQL